MPYYDFYPADRLHRHKDKQLGEEPFFHDHVFVRDSTIGAWTELMPHCTVVESTFGDYSYAAGNVSIIYSDVGKFCSIASYTRINPGNHPMWRVTQHHMTYRRKMYRLGAEDDPEVFQWRRDNRCTVGHDVWIGHGATIMPGVSIGTGAVIGAGAVVTKAVAPYTIAVGVPAKPLRTRFPDAVIDKLMQIAWWDWDRQTLEARFEDLYDLDRFLEKYG